MLPSYFNRLEEKVEGELCRRHSDLVNNNRRGLRKSDKNMCRLNNTIIHHIAHCMLVFSFVFISFGFNFWVRGKAQLCLVKLDVDSIRFKSVKENLLVSYELTLG